MSMQPSLGPFETSKLQNSGATTSNMTNSTKKQQLPVPQPVGDQQDPFKILLTRIFFHNSKNNRIGKHNVSLVLVEALYAVKGLEFLVSSKITRSNSIGTTSSSNTQQQFLKTGSTSNANQVRNYFVFSNF